MDKLFVNVDSTNVKSNEVFFIFFRHQMHSESVYIYLILLDVS